MTRKDFVDNVVEPRIALIRSVLAAKGDEYARGDGLYNFKRASAILGVTPAKACIGMLVKHMVSILDLVDDDEAGKHDRVARLLGEKIGDAINYLILLEAILKERCDEAARPETHRRDQPGDGVGGGESRPADQGLVSGWDDPNVGDG